MEVHVIWLRESVSHYSNNYFLVIRWFDNTVNWAMYVTIFVDLLVFFLFYRSDTCLTLTILNSIPCMSNGLLRLINAFLSWRLHTFTLLGENIFTWFWIPLWTEFLLVICLAYVGKAIGSWVILWWEWLPSRFSSVMHVRPVVSWLLLYPVPWTFVSRTVFVGMITLWRDMTRY